jgi:hypothetical protein
MWGFYDEIDTSSNTDDKVGLQNSREAHGKKLFASSALDKLLAEQSWCMPME